jgi:hypothetical protein
MDKLIAGVTGANLAPILLEAGKPSYEQAYSEWPVLTGASRDSIELIVTEINPRSARVVLQAGGEKLINDPRNKSGKDYAPFIEFNGTPRAPAGILRNSIYDRDADIRSAIHQGVRELIQELIA